MSCRPLHRYGWLTCLLSLFARLVWFPVVWFGSWCAGLPVQFLLLSCAFCLVHVFVGQPLVRVSLKAVLWHMLLVVCCSWFCDLWGLTLHRQKNVLRNWKVPKDLGLPTQSSQTKKASGRGRHLSECIAFFLQPLL